MFIIDCHRDESYCKMDDSYVVFNKDDPPKEGDTVSFFYKNNLEKGEVIMKSDNMKQINKKFEELKKSCLKRKHEVSPNKQGNSLIIDGKRPREVNSKYSSEFSENADLMKPSKKNSRGKKDSENEENKKKSELIIQQSIEREIEDNRKINAGKKAVKSPSKAELKKRLQEASKEFALPTNSRASGRSNESEVSKHTQSKQYKRIETFDSSSSLTESEANDSHEGEQSSPDNSKEVDRGVSGGTTSDEEEDSSKKSVPPETIDEKNEEDSKLDNAESDLYGKDWAGDKMVKLIDQVYCKKTDVDIAKSLCSQASHVVRRLITGVFKPSGYLNATFTGQAPRAHKDEGRPAEVKALNAIAKNEIIDYAMQLANEKQWKTIKGVPQTREELQRVMSQRIGELKRAQNDI